MSPAKLPPPRTLDQCELYLRAFLAITEACPPSEKRTQLLRASGNLIALLDDLDDETRALMAGQYLEIARDVLHKSLA